MTKRRRKSKKLCRKRNRKVRKKRNRNSKKLEYQTRENSKPRR